MDKEQYIAECISNYLSDNKLDLPLEHINALARSLEGALDEWRYCSGEQVATENWHANDRREHEQKGRNAVLREVEEQIANMDSGSSRCFDYMNHDQKLALSTLANLRHHLSRKGANQ